MILRDERPAATTSRPDFVSGLGELTDRYELILCDVWGVLHNGLVGFADARDALARFRRQGGIVVLVSNSPRPGASLATQLLGFGVGAEAYDAIVTSGDLTRAVLLSRRGQVPFHLGPERDAPMFEGYADRAATIAGCDYVVCTGLVEDEVETPDDYAAMLADMRARNLWMLCANPDILVERGASLIYCAGALAAVYETMGGETYYAGKPHPPAYEAALNRAAEVRPAPVDRARILAVGDAIRTDIAGAAAFGLDTLMIARGIHASELGYRDGTLDRPAAAAWLAEQAVQPTFATGALAW